ncbi:carbohydrate ABC transporter permease [Microbacterium azadirachtae]|uniref:Carbohydrate ABC transporter membrane protein 2, CUT1 family n=1 Tax=Microbacterium azadirachtae TaxID=582680 RepID=A0A0F0L5X6_9MICO|nr:carbohydrate ABC transporter permease [Microbacterium azadirachtae]KJL28587.1 Lactose transport system permease protein LacG [Microbacterium azadirachtae]UXW86046.1 carbohydrate ABC transporter permease [Microbacterium azadirachtae]SDL64905.1 carbohydrate ABC transporter membrane protein 2, CUT1 family [Microbacterium azadirachtae]SEF94111.1 carbohydrate ABC transporter membrane protein 2, CUT1 family [Microbacterium azadirachtae]SEF96660.1 carbohydrate ABC transporter membrane protein 2, C
MSRGGIARRRPSDWVMLVAAIALGLLIAVPLLLILINSFKSPGDYNTSGPLSLPKELYFDGIGAFWNRVDFPLKLWNSFFISGTVAVLAVGLSMLNAFALGIGRVKGRLWIVVLILLANMLPQEVLLYPLYFLFKQVGLYDNPWSVIITFTVIQSAFGTYLLASVFGTFPKEVLEAAALDGAGRWQVLWRVVFPISRPTLSVLLIFFFIWTWNEFLIPLTFLVSNANQTVPVAITALQGDRLMDVTTTSASALLGLLPTLVFFLIFQRTLTRGITAGAVK